MLVIDHWEVSSLVIDVILITHTTNIDQDKLPLFFLKDQSHKWELDESKDP